MKTLLEIFNNKAFLVIFLMLIFIIWFIIWNIIWKIVKYHEVKWYKLDAIKRSKSSILWEVYEKIIPFLPNFNYSPKDMVFIWKWVDYLVFDWLSSWDLNEIIFLEIKSWKSNLNKNEKMIQKIIWNKKIKYETLNIE
ncbi:MAG: hypothetical protein ACD_4C00144G0003 [uncultured bacterium (gcode 4)]|uniref:Holliday junction resolvase-related domain-containing protein n=1 Tax=uncultured bacterium (gcode 4) TaxID=1234023 RepID=K2FXZ7_9BACT|nr:MAG: hypothetical protein ACD_4C00144G0003 [uncultured bacterium (gcode 4)]